MRGIVPVLWLSFAIASPCLAQLPDESDPRVGELRLSEWRKKLADPDGNVRRSTCYKLGLLGKDAAPAIPLLADALARKDTPFSSLALVKIGPASIPALVSLAESDDAQVRSEAVYALGDMGPSANSAVLPTVIARLDDESPLVRSFACRSIRVLGTEADRAVPQLVKALDDDHEGVVATAAWSLEHYGAAAKPAVPRLVEILNADYDWPAKRAAAETLGAIGQPAAEPAVPVLIASLTDDRFRVWYAAGEALRPLADAAVPALIEALEDEQSDRRAAAAKTLGRIARHADAAVPALVKALRDRESEVRHESATALGLFGDDARSAVPALLEALGNDPELGEDVARALGRIGPATAPAVPQLASLLKVERVSTRMAAARALGQIGPAAHPAVPALISALDDEKTAVTYFAARALGEIGPKAKSALPALRRYLVTTRSKSGRDHATKAIEQIDK